ncbi:MAG: UvrD-helicase domain-containing protein [Ruminococcus sp.]|nr:UvrD-helicase domain-containing protein [Ruminococcus sp.]
MSDTIKFTAEQLDAIESDNTSVIVSAAAGSGKTKVLVERLIRQICDEKNPISVSDLTMVTFTNDAAAGMRKKLFTNISEKIRKNPGNVRLRRELSLIPIAKISTINAFCLRLLRDQIADLPVSAGFFVLDETRADSMLRAAVDEVFERRYSENDKDIDFLADIFNNEKRDSTKLSEIILSLYKKLRSLPFYREFLPKIAQNYRDGIPKEFADEYIRIIHSELAIALSDANIASENAKKYGFEKLHDSIQDDINLIKTEEQNFRVKVSLNLPFEQLVNRIEFPRLTKGTNPKKEELTEKELIAFKLIDEKRSDYKSRCFGKKSFISNLFSTSDIIEDLAYNADVTQKLSALINEIDDEFRSLKSNVNAVDFSDTEQFAVDILSEKKGEKIYPSAIAKQIAATNKVVMIDEYQDSNDVQDLIFKLISHRGEDNLPDNLFCVGDIKQSIYGFRAANPRIFMRTVGDAKTTRNPKLIKLSKNFRSSREVVDFVNAVFNPLLKKDTFDGINYAEDMLVYGGDYNDEISRMTEIIVAEENEAIAVAERIREMLHNGETVKIGNDYRRCKPSDFCILMRDRKLFSVYEKALRSLGIKASKESTDTFLSSYEIQVLLNLLRVIDNPKQDIPLASVMMSPMFDFSSDEMAEIRLSDRKSPLFTAVKNYEKLPLQNKINHMFDVINSLRRFSRTLSADALLQLIFDRTDFMNSLSYRLADGMKKKANLRLMTQYAKSYTQNDFFGGISDFIRYIENIIRSKGDFSSAANNSESDDAVLIKTIHKSKGLEFPFVFLCDISKRYNEQDIREPLIFHSEYGVGVRYQKRADYDDFSEQENIKRYKTFPQVILSNLRKKELRAESLRLLYVALTRAKERLFIATTKDDLYENFKKNIVDTGKPQPEIIHNLSNFLSLLSAALSSHPDGYIFRNETAKTTPMLFKTSLVSSKTSDESSDSEIFSYKPDPDVVKNLLEMWSQTYPHEETEKAAKLTVSEIALNSDLARVYSVKNISLRFDKKTISETPKLTASEKGTAMHRFLQKCDFNSAEKNVDAEIERLQNAGIMSELEISGLNRAKINEFFKSELYKNTIKPAKPEEIRREYKIYAKVSDIGLDERLKKEYNISDDSFLQGVTDLIVVKEDGLILVDYKTNANFFRNSGVKTSEQLFEEHLRALYNLQIKIYAAAISAIFDKPVASSYLYSFALDRAIEIF